MLHNNKRVYRNKRPLLVVEFTGEANLGRCYNASYYTVTSTKPQSAKTLNLLLEAGFLGFGQELLFYQEMPDEKKAVVLDKVDCSTVVESTGMDIVQSVEVNHCDVVVRSPSINPYTGKEDKPQNVPYYIYKCETRVDSSD